MSDMGHPVERPGRSPRDFAERARANAPDWIFPAMFNFSPAQEVGRNYDRSGESGIAI